ncbi:DNA polymerase III subunit beta [Alkaliphilus serpentinus]|uniref:Beta sliding clamp n=1 Tax=Alkaliphilus serpentinus TaxID=1482731 RepID=A0A833HQU7_9FIRM|nr:DNA polymerase III subunit beta [Alkaliphilus serpentinus]KAB3532223.1 DNA polymerase III subunit beta [Alkaliphilus serpentinus]
MHFSCPQRTLLNSINIVQKSVSTRTTLPILKGIYIEAQEHHLKLVATDLEVGIENLLDAEIISEGAFVIDAKLFGEIIRKLPDDDVEIKLIDSNQVFIKCQSAEFNVLCHNAEDFPELPSIDDKSNFSISNELFRNMIRQTVFATSQDESRPILTGVLMEIDEDSFNMVALDGYRLALRKGKIKSELNRKVVIPSRTLTELSRIISNDDEEDVEICLSENHAQFRFSNTKIISRLLEGEFINYKQIIPKEYKSRVKINTKSLLNSIERASLLAKEGKNNLVKFIVSDENMVITSNSELGKVHEEIIITLEGEEIEIAFNSKYFMDALKVFDEEEIYLNFTTNISPVIFKPVSNDHYTYLVLPIRLSSN